MHVITSLDTGGAEMMLSKLVRGMDRSRFAVDVVSLTTSGRIGTVLQQEGISVTVLDLRPGRPSFSGLLRLAALMRRKRPDLIQTWLYHADLYGLLAARLAGVGRVLWNIRCSCYAPHDFPLLLRLVVRLLASMSHLPAAVIANSEAGRQVHEKIGYHSVRWEVIPNGFDPELFRPDPEARRTVREELGIGNSTLLVGLIGRFDQFKDHGTFLKATALLRQQFGNIRFLLAGRGVTDSNPGFRELVAATGGCEGLILLGERTDIPSLTAALDIAVCSSYSEGFPNVIGEAMSCAVPCVVTDVGDCAMVVGDTGLVVPPRSPERLANGIAELLKAGTESRRQMGMRARERIMANFSLERIIQRYEQLYYEIIGRS